MAASYIRPSSDHLKCRLVLRLGENDGHGHNGDTNADKNLFHLISF